MSTFHMRPARPFLLDIGERICDPMHLKLWPMHVVP